jgi:hypothetical protein
VEDDFRKRKDVKYVVWEYYIEIGEALPKCDYFCNMFMSE